MITREQEMDRKTTMFIAVMLLLLAYVLTGAQVLIAVAAAFSLFYMVPLEHLQKFMGYLVVTDILFSWWLVGVAAATLGGFTIAVFAGLTYTVMTREIKAAWGFSKLSIDGHTEFRRQFARLSEQGIAWVKALAAGIRSGHVEAPEPMLIEWVEVDPGGGWKATRLYAALQKIKEMIFGSWGTAVAA